MGQPIELVKGGEKTTVYGMAQLAVMVADGWQRADSVPAVAPEPEPEPAAKPAKSPPAKRK